MIDYLMFLLLLCYYAYQQDCDSAERIRRESRRGTDSVTDRQTDRYRDC